MNKYTIIESPIGPLMLVADGDVLVRLDMADRAGRHRPEEGWNKVDSDPVLGEARRQLDLYFAGKLNSFDLPMRMDGTDFQRSVWEQLRRIPFGTTISYGELAKRVGNPAASRAVGLANGRNPIAVIVPCHRVIGANGKLVGFGGGLDRKRTLLDLESKVAEPKMQLA